MITRSKLQKISQLSDENGHLLSLYLPLFQDANDTDYNIELKNLLRGSSQRFHHEYDRELPPEFESLFDDIRTYIRDNAGTYGRGICLFASPERGIITTQSAPGSIESSAIVGPQPNLAPLIRLVEDYAPYAVCVISRDQAKIFLGHIDDLEEVEHLRDDEVPGQHDQGGWSQSRYERHIEDHVHRHFKRVAQQLFEMHEKKKFEHLILGGPEEVVSGFEDVLHQYVQQRVISHVRLLMEANVNDVRAHSLEALTDHICNRKRDLISEVEGQSLARDNGVHGLTGTIDALQQGQVMTLVVDAQVRSSGVICQSCGAMSVSPGEGNTCLYCQSKDIRDMDNVIPGLITAAFQQGAAVSVIDDDEQREEIAKLGGIGALLRFRVEEQTA